MKILLNWNPSFEEIAESITEDANKAVSYGMAWAGAEIKDSWREEIIAAGLGKRLSFTIRDVVYPKNIDSVNAAALVWSKSPHIISAHNEGATIRSQEGFWLAIPLPSAGNWGRGAGKPTPGTWEKRNNQALRFVYRPGRPALLVADDARVSKRGLAKRKGGRRRKTDNILTGAQTVPIFVLVPQVRLEKRLDLEGTADRVASMLPSAITANWGN